MQFVLDVVLAQQVPSDKNHVRSSNQGPGHRAGCGETAEKAVPRFGEVPWFNAAPFPPDESYGCAISVYALDTETAPSGPSRIGNALMADALVMARSPRDRLDRDPATWQRLDTELRLPPNTEFVVVRLHITQAYDAQEKPVVTGSYADDVSVSLIRRPPGP